MFLLLPLVWACKEIKKEVDKTFTPIMEKEERKNLLKNWKEAVKRSKNWQKKN